MSKNTIAQWTQAKYSETDVIAEDGTMIASAREGLNGITHEQAVAHARLIAAAPELLDALQLAVRHMSGGKESFSPMEFDRAFKLARAAIQKATS